MSTAWPASVYLSMSLALAGCGGGTHSAASMDTGARAAAEEFFGGLIAGDPRRSYEVLDVDSQRRVSLKQFERMAAAYARNLGFQAEKLHIQACEEQGDTAIAHVRLSGSAAGHSRHYADGASLRRNDGRWVVVLPANFAQKVK